MVAGVITGFLALLLLLYPKQSLRRLVLQSGGKNAAGRVYLDALLRQNPNDQQLRRVLARLTSAGQSQPVPLRQAAVHPAPVGAAQYRADAATAFAAMATAPTIAQRRVWFLRGVRTLQAGNLVQEALQEGERHLGLLANDRETLIVMTRIALAANRPDKAQRFIEQALGMKRGV